MRKNENCPLNRKYILVLFWNKLSRQILNRLDPCKHLFFNFELFQEKMNKIPKIDTSRTSLYLSIHLLVTRIHSRHTTAPSDTRNWFRNGLTTILKKMTLNLVDFFDFSEIVPFAGFWTTLQLNMSIRKSPSSFSFKMDHWITCTYYYSCKPKLYIIENWTWSWW